MIFNQLQDLFNSDTLANITKKSGLHKNKVLNVRTGRRVLWDEKFMKGLMNLGYEVVITPNTGLNIIDEIVNIFKNTPINAMIAISGLNENIIEKNRKGRRMCWNENIIDTLKQLGYIVELKKVDKRAINFIDHNPKKITLDEMAAKARELGYKSYGQMQADLYLKARITI